MELEIITSLLLPMYDMMINKASIEYLFIAQSTLLRIKLCLTNNFQIGKQRENEKKRKKENPT